MRLSTSNKSGLQIQCSQNSWHISNLAVSDSQFKRHLTCCTFNTHGGYKYRCNVNKSDSPENVWHLETSVLLIWYGFEWHDNFLGETVKRNSQEGDVGISLSSLPLLDGSHLRQLVKHCMHHSTCVVMDCAAREWHEISRSDLPPLLVASLPPPWSHRKQFVTPSCAIDCVVYVLCLPD